MVCNDCSAERVLGAGCAERMRLFWPEWIAAVYGRRSSASDSGQRPDRDPGRRRAAKFNSHFERMWDAARLMIEFAPTINPLEPK